MVFQLLCVCRPATERVGGHEAASAAQRHYGIAKGMVVSVLESSRRSACLEEHVPMLVDLLCSYLVVSQ